MWIIKSNQNEKNKEIGIEKTLIGASNNWSETVQTEMKMFGRTRFVYWNKNWKEKDDKTSPLRLRFIIAFAIIVLMFK